jgi:Domain of unknown function (DUF4034)
MKPILQLGLLSLAFLLPGMQESSGQTPAASSKIERVRDWKVLQDTVHQLVTEEKFAELESLHKKLLGGEEKCAEGRYKIEFFYEPLEGSRIGANDKAGTQTWFDKIEAWKKVYPNSSLPLIAEAATWVNQAWVARGNGYSQEVSEDGWKMYRERIAKAKDLLTDAKRKAPPGRLPYGWYQVMQSVALGQGWKLDRYDTLFEEAVTVYPDYVGSYFKKAHYLLPRWFGDDGDLEAFAEKVRAEGNPEFYTRIIWSQQSYYKDGNVFNSSHVRWDWMREGFEEMMKKYPESEWNLSSYCRFACQAGDKATAHRLFVELKGLYWKAIWPSEKAYMDYFAWASKKD